MAWIKIHGEFLDSWKIADVCESLNISEAQAIGHIVSLWCFTERNAWQDGDLTRWKAPGVAKAARWAGKPAVFVEALQKATLLDPGALVVHDWTKHQARMIHDRGSMRQYSGKPWGGVGGDVGKVPTKPPTREEKIREDERRGGERAPARVKIFTKPCHNDIKIYAAELGHPSFNARKFISHYEANGWMVGRVPMQDWQAAVRSWLEGSAAGGSFSPIGGRPANPVLEEIAERKRQEAEAVKREDK